MTYPDADPDDDDGRCSICGETLWCQCEDDRTGQGEDENNAALNAEDEAAGLYDESMFWSLT